MSRATAPAAAGAADALAVFTTTLPAGLTDPASILAVLHTRLLPALGRESRQLLVRRVRLAVRFDLRAGLAEAAGRWLAKRVGTGADRVVAVGCAFGRVSGAFPDPNAVFVNASRPILPGGMLFVASDGIL